MKRPLQSSRENITDASGSRAQEMREATREIVRTAPVATGRSNPRIPPSRRRIARRPSRMPSIARAEDILRCPICKSTLRSPRTMPCGHTFCLRCLINQIEIMNEEDGSGDLTCPVCNVTVKDCAPEKLPTDLHVEKLLSPTTSAKGEERAPKGAVRFAPLPPKIRDEKYPPNCRSCGEIGEKRCKHCKRRFCYSCWTSHVDDLKEELINISEDLEASATRFENRISDFRGKANEIRDFISRDIEAKIGELCKKRDNRIKKVEHVVATGEASVEDIKRRLQRVHLEIKEERDVSFDLLPNNKRKIKTFLDLQQKAAEIMAAITVWEAELNNVETGLGRINKHGGSFIKENVGPLYKRKTFAPKIIVNRDTVLRPSALAVDSWRDHIIATCPGSGQVVILDRRYKLIRRIRHREMMAPQGVAFLQESDEIYVTDKWRHCIFVFDHKGELVRRMCDRGQGESQLRSPEGITFHPERSVLYVADTGNDRVQILGTDGAYVSSIGPAGKGRAIDAVRIHRTGPSQLNQPTDVAVTTTRVVVADSGSHKIKIFDHDGEILQAIGGVGTSKGLFRSPEVLRIDKKGNIIVGDAGNGRVQIFSPEGEFLRMLGAKGSKERPFGWVSGVLVTNNYDIFIADSRNNVIYLFST